MHQSQRGDVSVGNGDGSAPETCPGCALRVPDHSTWERQHREDCGGSCWCRAYCWKDGDCPPDLSAIRARARAEAFEECARIAKDCADERRRQLAAGGRSERVNDALFGKLTEASRIEDLIRRRAKP